MPASDIAIKARAIFKTRERIARTIARGGKSLEPVRVDIERNLWRSAEEAPDYWLVFSIIERRTELQGA